MKYIIYSNNKAISNFYVYDSDLQANFGRLPSKYFSHKNSINKQIDLCNSFYNGKNKLNSKNGCLKQYDISKLDEFKGNPEYISIEIPSSELKYMVFIPNENGIPYGLSIKFKHEQKYDKINKKVIDFGGRTLIVKCQYFPWIASQNVDLTGFNANKLKDDGYFLMEIKKDEDKKVPEDNLANP